LCGAPASEFVEVTEGEAPAPAAPQATPAGRSSPSSPQAPAASPVAPLVQPKDDSKAGIYAMSYGLFVISSKDGGKFNAQTANTVFQVTSEPVRVAVGINKANLTHEFIEKSGVLAITVLGKGNLGHVRHFGFKSGRNVDKLAAVKYELSPKIGCPILPDGVAYLECEVKRYLSSDVGTHILYVADVVGGGALRKSAPITYAYYRANKDKPDDYEGE